MEFSNKVLQSLTYLASSSYISDDNFKKLIYSALGLLSGEPNIERLSSICPEKSDIIKQAYASVLTFTIEVVQNRAEEEVQNFLAKHNFKSDRIEFYLKVLSLSKDNIVKSLENINSGWPSIVDADWRLDFIIKSNMQNHIEGPLYYIVLTTEKNGKLDYVKFTCNLHQLQDFSSKLKEIVDEYLLLNMAENLWNFWEVKPPPVCTVRTDLNFKDITALNKVTFDALKTLQKLDYLDKEAAILSRFLYKNQRIFRHDKGIQNLVKVNQCLKRYLKLNLLDVLFTFKESIPRKLNCTTTIAYLPTKQMLQWILLRLQAFAQLFVRVTELTITTGAYLHQKLCLGWSLNHSLLVFSITARLFVTSKFLVAKSIEWYNSFYKCLPYLKQTTDSFSNYNFPVDLKQWLGDVDLVPLKKKTFIDKIFEFVNLDDEESEDNDEVQTVNEKFSKKLFKEGVTKGDSDTEEVIVEKSEDKRKEIKQRLHTFSEQEDLGVPVEDSERPVKRKKSGKRLNSLKKLKKN